MKYYTSFSSYKVIRSWLFCRFLYDSCDFGNLTPCSFPLAEKLLCKVETTQGQCKMHPLNMWTSADVCQSCMLKMRQSFRDLRHNSSDGQMLSVRNNLVPVVVTEVSGCPRIDPSRLGAEAGTCHPVQIIFGLCFLSLSVISGPRHHGSHLDKHIRDLDTRRSFRKNTPSIITEQQLLWLQKIIISGSQDTFPRSWHKWDLIKKDSN